MNENIIGRPFFDQAKHLAVALILGLAHWVYFDVNANIPRELLLFQSLVVAGIGHFTSKNLLTKSTSESWHFLIVTVLISAYWAPLGFDLTDQGRRLAFEWHLFDGNTFQLLDSKFGSHLIGYLWLHILDNPSVIWSRLGYVLVQAFSTALIYHMLKRKATHKASFAVGVVAVLFINYFTIHIMDYNNIPLLLILAAASFSLWPEKKTIPNAIPLLLGVLVVLSVVSRIPYLPYLAIPFVIYWIRSKNPWSKQSTFTLLGYLLSGVAFFLLMWLWADPTKYMSNLRETYLVRFLAESSESLAFHAHDRNSLMEGINIQLERTVTRGWPAALLVAGLVIFQLGKWPKLGWVFTGVAAASAFAFLEQKNLVYYMLALLAACTIAVVLLKHLYKRVFPVEYWIWASIIAIMGFVGSNIGIRNIFYSGSGAFLLGLLLITLASPKKTSSAIVSPVWGAALLLTAILWVYKTEHIYRDLPQHELTTAFQASPLKGIYSHQAKVNAIDSMYFATVTAVDTHTLLCVNTVPAFHYLLNARWSESPYWFMRSKSSEEKALFLESSNGPEFIVVSLKDPRDPAWPKSEKPCMDRDAPYLKYYTDYLPGSPYERVYKSSALELWRKP